MIIGPEQGLVFYLTCLRLHRKIRLSLQYAVHQSGAVAIGGVISICSCHLHHRRAYRTDKQTWETSQGEITLPQVMQFKNGLTNKLVTMPVLIHLPVAPGWKKGWKNTLILQLKDPCVRLVSAVISLHFIIAWWKHPFSNFRDFHVLNKTLKFLHELTEFINLLNLSKSFKHWIIWKMHSCWAENMAVYLSPCKNWQFWRWAVFTQQRWLSVNLLTALDTVKLSK